MKRRDLEKQLRDEGCDFLEHGKRHDTWVNPRTGQQASVPRHTEIKFGTAKAVCRDLAIRLIKKR